MLKKSSAPAKKGKATELSQKVADVLVGLRQARQLSQRAFAEHIGVSFQQYQKYEKGRDRLSLEKALLLCHELGLPLTVFSLDGDKAAGFAETEQDSFGSSASVLGDQERELLAVFATIPKGSKKDFLETVKQLAKMTSVKN